MVMVSLGQVTHESLDVSSSDHDDFIDYRNHRLNNLISVCRLSLFVGSKVVD